MATSEDLKAAYQTIAECQALHPDPLDDVVEDDEVGSGKYYYKIFQSRLLFYFIFVDIDYGNEDETNENGNHEDDDPYGYNAHFASGNQGTRGSRFGGHRRGQHDDQGKKIDNKNNF